MAGVIIPVNMTEDTEEDKVSITIGDFKLEVDKEKFDQMFQVVEASGEGVEHNVLSEPFKVSDITITGGDVEGNG